MTTQDRYERVEAALRDIRDGKMVILVDDEDRENEGDLTMAADAVTPEAINFMARFGRGLICLTLTEEKADTLELPLQARKGGSGPLGTAFTVSIEARRGVTSGISAHDRAVTIKAAVKADARPDDLVTPGHVFPLRARRGGVLVRTGHTEGSVDLARLAGREPAGVICEIMNDDGSMARMPELELFSAQHGLAILSIADLIDYRLRKESLVEERVDSEVRLSIPGLSPAWRARLFGSAVESTEYLALTRGELQGGDPVLVRVQSACIPGDVFGVQTCDCRAQLIEALNTIDQAGRGVLLYVYPTGRRSLLGDFRGHVLHEDDVAGRLRPEEKLREFGLGAQVLRHLGIGQIRLLTNNPKKIVGLEGYGLVVKERLPIEVGRNRDSLRLIERRREREGYDVNTTAPSDGKESA